MNYSFKFARFDPVVEICSDAVSVLEIADRRLFARVVESLRSEAGQCAIEPYHFFEGTKAVSPKGKLLFLSDLPMLPLHDRMFEKVLYEGITKNFEDDGRTNDMEVIRENAFSIRRVLEGCTLAMWGNYSFGLNWDIAGYLKAFNFGLDIEPGASFLERCISFFGLLVDIRFKKPLIAVNIKSFLSDEEVNQLNEQAIFHGIQMLELESWVDEHPRVTEKKICLEQVFS